jgi:hypothetical protein
MHDEKPPEEITRDDIDTALSAITAGLDEVSNSDQLGYLKGRLAGLPRKLRDAVEPLVLKACNISERESVSRTRNQMELWEKITILILGLVLLTVIFVTAFEVPNPTVFQKHVFCVILGLAAAATGAILPGFIKIESKTDELWIRAGGAFALLVVVLMWFCR